MAPEELIRSLDRLGAPRIAVLGDFMLDWYVWGDARRVSPEAPVPVVKVRREEQRLGGAGNVVANLCEMGARASCFGFIGEDAQGAELRRQLEACGAGAEGLGTSASAPTIQKIRVMARSQQMLRVDREEPGAFDAGLAASVLERLCAEDWEVLVLSDYGKGALGMETTAAALGEAQRRGAISLVDPKRPDLAHYRGATLITPNRAEAEAAAGCSLADRGALAEAGERLRSEAGVEGLLITLGSEGMFLVRAEHEPLHVPTRARSVYDVTGAGDTVIAMLALALGSGADWETAVRLANTAAGLVVAKVGTAPVGRVELRHHLNAVAPERKILAPGDDDGLLSAIAALRRSAARVVFTNGCFDILHAGHVRYLQEAAGLGDALVIGLNDDDSVRRLKGPERPFNDIEDRAEVLAALDCVDLVVPFAEDTPESLIRRVCPDVLVKGADWREKGVVGAEFVEARGGEVRLIELLPGRSTSGLAERIRRP